MKKARVFGVIALVCLCIAAVFLLDTPTYIKVWRGQEQDLAEIDPYELKKGDVVSGDAGWSYGYCAEEYQTNFGIRTSKDSTKRYYVMLLNSDDFILYCTSVKSEYTQLDKMEDELIAYYDSWERYEESEDPEDLKIPESTIDIQGSVTKIPSEIEGYFREWYAECVGDDYNESVVPLMINHMNFDSFGTMMIAGIAAAVGAVIFGILALVMRIKAKKSEFDFY